MEMETDHHQLEMNKKKSTSSSRSTVNMFSTESCLTVVLPEICHNSVNTPSPGSSTCMGICLFIFKEFVQDTMSLSRNNISHMMGVFEECVKLGYEYWKINELIPMDVNTALKLSLLQNQTDKSQIKCDAMWHTKLKVNGFEALKYEMESAKDSYTSGIFGHLLRLLNIYVPRDMP